MKNEPEYDGTYEQLALAADIVRQRLTEAQLLKANASAADTHREIVRALRKALNANFP